MDIFISWSGPRSRAVAEALKEYLPMIVNAFNPWLSSADIDKGARWASELAAALETAKAGIICLTPNNLTEPYILFESGALSKTVDKTFVCTLLIGMEPSDVSLPLAQFQATKPTKDDLLQLLKTLNRALGESALKDSQVQATFELCWPKLKEKLENLPPDGPTGRPHRSERELLEELVDSVRSTSAQDTTLLKQVAEGMANLSVRLTNIEALSQPYPMMISTPSGLKFVEGATFSPATGGASTSAKITHGNLLFTPPSGSVSPATGGASISAKMTYGNVFTPPSGSIKVAEAKAQSAVRPAESDTPSEAQPPMAQPAGVPPERHRRHVVPPRRRRATDESPKTPDRKSGES